MAKFLLLYGGGQVPEDDEERAGITKAWEDWFTELGAAVADPGNPFTPEAKRVTNGGAIADATPTATGYSIVEADSIDQAAKLASGCPVLLGGGDVTVYETFDVM